MVATDDSRGLEVNTNWPAEEVKATCREVHGGFLAAHPELASCDAKVTVFRLGDAFARDPKHYSIAIVCGGTRDGIADTVDLESELRNRLKKAMDSELQKEQAHDRETRR